MLAAALALASCASSTASRVEVATCTLPTPGPALMGKLPPEPKLATEKDGGVSLSALKRGYLRMKTWGRINRATASRLQAHIRDVEATKRRCADGSPGAGA